MVTGALSAGYALHIVPKLGMLELYLHSVIHLNGIVLK
jgi:hypothetical protein